MTVSRPQVLSAATVDALPEAPATVTTALAELEVWWSRRVDLAGLGSEWKNLATAVDAVAPQELDFGPVSSGLPHDSYALGSLYVNRLPTAERADYGKHYTPRDLADRLWRMGRNALGFGEVPRRLHGLVRDPAVGAGSLLVPVVREHLEASSEIDPEFVLASLPQFVEGLDTDPRAVYLANVVLASEMLPTLARVPESRRRPLPSLARVCNSLEEELAPALLWIMNPPYGRQKLSPKMRNRYSGSLYGQANLYALFIACALSGLGEDGAVAVLVPTSFASGSSFRKLRGQLAESAPLRSITFMKRRSGVFAGVLQETCLAVFTPKRSECVEVTRLSPEAEFVAIVPSPRTSHPWVMPRDSIDAAIAAGATQMQLNLGMAGWKASTGPLVWNRRKENLHAGSSKTRAHVVWAADIDGGRLHRDPRRDLHRYVALRDSADELTLTLSEPAILVQRTTSPEQCRRLVAVELDRRTLNRLGNRVVVENHLNVLLPTVEHPMLSRSLLARLLATRTFDRLLRCISGSVAVSAYELEALPLPSIEELEAWEHLLAEELEEAVLTAYVK